MANYRIAQDAKADLRRIYRTGFDRWGEATADKYYTALFERFEQLAEQPLLYPAVEHIRKGYRKSVCGVGNGVEIMNILGRQNRQRWIR